MSSHTGGPFARGCCADDDAPPAASMVDSPAWTNARRVVTVSSSVTPGPSGSDRRSRACGLSTRRSLEADEARALFHRLLFVVLIAENQRGFARTHFPNVVVDPHPQPSRQNQDDLLARVTVRLSAGPLGLGVVTDLQFVSGDGWTVRRRVSGRHHRFGHFIELEEWHDASPKILPLHDHGRFARLYSVETQRAGAPCVCESIDRCRISCLAQQASQCCRRRWRPRHKRRTLQAPSGTGWCSAASSGLPDTTSAISRTPKAWSGPPEGG